MTTAELIKELQFIDPSGEVEINVNGCAIVDVTSCPAYWDGPLGVILFDPSEDSECRTITGIELRRRGRKITLETYGWKEMLWNTGGEGIINADHDLPDQLRVLIARERERILKAMEFRKKRERVGISDQAKGEIV